MPSLRSVLVPAAALVAAAVALSHPGAAGGETFDYRRWFEPASKGSGEWAGKFLPGSNEGELVGLAVDADWWEGPGDPRAGDDARSVLKAVVYEVRRGTGPWTPLPPADRDLRLAARTAAPEAAKALLGGSAGGDWSVRQAAGGEFPRRLRLEFTCRGDALLVMDLRVASIRLPGIDPPERVGRPYLPDRVENATLAKGTDVQAVVVVENCGARRTKEVDLDLLAVPFEKRQGGKRLGFVQVPRLKPGETAELTVGGKFLEDLAEESGAWEVLAVVDPRGTLAEVETFNNALGRAFTFKATEKPKLPEDLRDR